VVVIAQDAQGAEVAKPWVEEAGGMYRALLDQHNQIGKAYSLKFLPVAIILDEAGRLVRPVGSVNIVDEEFLADLTLWAETNTLPERWLGTKETEIRPMTEDEREAAVTELKEAFKLDPQNWLIRKQLWAIETPEVSYEGDVYYGWQKEQISREDAVLQAD
tara:strand:- start:4346 stop:4828 length:483 start_codon:yes stop_codon:yes gene_type:complete